MENNCGSFIEYENLLTTKNSRLFNDVSTEILNWYNLSKDFEKKSLLGGCNLTNYEKTTFNFNPNFFIHR